MQNNPLVTLIIPVYNVSRYLAQCLDSVFMQDYRNLEILIIDDGSTDDSGRMCDAFAEKDSRTAVFHTENRGLSAARNYGLDRAHGAYIAFLDSDDWMEPFAIQTLVRYALQHDADIVACNVCREWVNKTVYPAVPDEITVCDGEQALHDFICYGYREDGVWNKLYAARMFADLRFPIGRVCEDVAVTYRLLGVAQRYVGIPDVLFHYRMRRSGISRADQAVFQLDFWLARQEMYEALQEKGPRYRWGCITRCIRSLKSIWLQYDKITKQLEDLDAAKKEAVFGQIHDFVHSHLSEVLRGDYTGKEKLVFCLAMCHHPLYMRMVSSMARIGRKTLRAAGKLKAGKNLGDTEEILVLFA